MTTTFKKIEYLVQVTIVEARNLKGKDASGTSDPYVKVTVANLPPQVTTTAKATSSMTWNQSFTFTNLLLSETELETMEILLEVFDLNDFALNPLIGAHSVGLATLYRNMNHEFYNSWLPLMNPEVSSEPQGYLLTSCYIIGPQDQPPVHAINEIVYFDEEPDDLAGVPQEELTPEQLQKIKNRNKTVAELSSKPALVQRGYQLRINIAKAEDIAQIGYSSPDPFISVRCCGFLLTTPVANETQKPVFNSKLQFPVYLPLLNDKIVIRAWDQRKGLPDYFIASIPEVPSETDYFNINSLLAKGGNMPYRWINLYGIPKDERTSELAKLIAGKPKLFEGTTYMGRVLMSINLAPNEKPVKGRFPLNSYREPPETDYTLFADVYELQEAVGCGEYIWVKITMGNLVMESKKAFHPKNSDTKSTYTWKEKQIILKEITHPFPTDQSQIPDIIVSLYTETFWGIKRIGYLRLPVSDPSLTNNDPKWYPVKSVENNIDNTKVGFLLINLQFTSSKKKGSRVAKRRNINHNFYFVSYIHAAYDLAPDLPPESVHPSAEVMVGKKLLTPKKNEHHGKNPVWEDWICEEVELTQNLEFASNVTFRVKNVPTGLIEKGQELISGGLIGEFSIPAMECTQIKKIDDYMMDPKMYILYKDGKPQGRILVSFTLVKNVKKMIDMTKVAEDQLGKKQKFTIEFAVVGIRNLKPPFREPTIHLKIAGYDKEIKPIKALPDDDNGDSANPNFLEIIKVDNVELYEDPLYLPPIEIEVKNNRMLGSSLYLTFPMWEYAEWATSSRLVEVSNIFNASMTVAVKKEDKDKAEKKEKEPEKDKTKLEKEREKVKAAGGFAINIPGGDLKNVIDESKKLLDKEAKKEKKEMDIVFNKAKYAEKAKKKEVEWDLENLQEELNNAKAAEQDQGQDSDEEFMGRTTATTDSNFRMDVVDTFDCTKKDKEKERNEKKALIDEKLDKIKELKAEAVPRLEEINKYVQEINKLKGEFVDVVKFRGHNDKMGEDYDYGRPITKDPVEKNLALPYINYELCKFIPILTSSREENGIIKSGLLTEAVLKGLVRVTLKDEEGHEAVEKKSHKSKGSRASRASKASSKNRALRFQRNDLDDKYPFDIFNPIYLKYFRSPKPLKIRLYLLRALNLTAQEDVVELNNKLAGYIAMSSANTFPILKVGEPNKQGFDLTKEINDEKALVLNTLNPNFFKNYELDAKFPEDWKLEIQIMNKGTIMASQIGYTIIDLEDRYFGDKHNKQKLAYELRRKFLDDELKRKEQELQAGGQNTNIHELEAKITQYRKENVLLAGNLEGLGKSMALVEYRALKNASKNTSQGSLEMFLEVLTTDIARTQPVAKIEPPKPTEYEIRVIIYETFDIPRTGGDTVDIFVKVAYSPDGWSGQDITKTTDTHLGSSDGYGLFNWRMKFPLTIPCAFPRVRFSAYDMNVFASDESLGEAAISLRRIMKKLVTEGKFEQAPKRIQLYHPNQPGKSMGEILYALQIIPKLEAEASPVGEAQEEPNENPYLEKPKIGRGIGDFLKGAGFSFNLFGFFSSRLFKIILGVIASAVVILILFVKPGILVN